MSERGLANEKISNAEEKRIYQGSSCPLPGLEPRVIPNKQRTGSGWLAGPRAGDEYSEGGGKNSLSAWQSTLTALKRGKTNKCVLGGYEKSIG